MSPALSRFVAWSIYYNKKSLKTNKKIRWLRLCPFTNNVFASLILGYNNLNQKIVYNLSIRFFHISPRNIMFLKILFLSIAALSYPAPFYYLFTEILFLWFFYKKRINKPLPKLQQITSLSGALAH